MNWKIIQTMIDERTALFTKRGQLFLVTDLTETSIIIKPGSNCHYMIPRAAFEQAVTLAQQGQVFASPADYRRQVSVTQPSYAWSILQFYLEKQERLAGPQRPEREKTTDGYT